MNHKDYLNKYLLDYNTIYRSLNTLEDAIKKHLETVANSSFLVLNEQKFIEADIKKTSSYRDIWALSKTTYKSDIPINKIRFGLYYKDDEFEGAPQPYLELFFSNFKSKENMWKNIPNDTEPEDPDTDFYNYDTSNKGSEIQMYLDIQKKNFSDVDELIACYEFLLNRFAIDYKKYISR